MFQNKTEIIGKLEKIGLGRKEAQVYLKLAKFDKLGIGKLALETGLSRQNLYNYLELLKNKNLVGEVIENGRKKFFAKDVRNLENDLKNRLDLIGLLDEEMAEYKLKYSSGIKLYKGKKKIQRLFIERMKKQANGDQMFCTETDMLGFTDKLMEDYFNLYENIRVNRKFKVNVLIVLENEVNLKSHKELSCNSRPYNETRVIKQAPFGFSALYIWRDRVWILLKDNTEEEFEILEIVSRDVTLSFEFYFKALWEKGEVVYRSKD